MSVSIEEQVGDTSPHMFTTRQTVLLRNLHPMAASKWRLAIISGQLGPLAYEVDTESQTRQAHVNHLKLNSNQCHLTFNLQMISL